MRSSIRWLFLLAALATLGGAAGCPGKGPATLTPAAPPAPADVDQAVRSRVEQYRQGYEVRSLEALAPLYDRSDALWITHQGRSQRGWAQAEAAIGGFLAAASTCKLRVAELSVSALGDSAALATMLLSRSYGDGVTTVDESGTLTLVFARRGDDWLIIAEHFSYAPVAAP